MSQINKFIIFIFTLLSCIQAQNLNVSLRTNREPRGQIWIVEGTTDLPHDTVLTVRLLRNNIEIRDSKRVIRTRGKQLRYQFGPFSGVAPSGEYQAEISFHFRRQAPAKPQKWLKKPYDFSKWQKIAPFSQRFSMQIGNRLSERREQRRWRIFFRNFLNEIEQWRRQGLKRLENHLKTVPLDIAQISAWQDKNSRHLKKIGKKLYPWVWPQMIIAYMPRDMRDTQSLFQLATQMQRQCDIVIKKLYYNLRRKNKQVPALTAVIFESKRISKTLTRIRKRLPRPGASSLQQDMMWFNEMFKGLIKRYRKARVGFRSRNWGAYLDNLNRESLLFRTRMKEYQNTKLSKKYPDLFSVSEKMSLALQRLAHAYSTVLYRKNGRALPKGIRRIKEKPGKIIDTLQQQYASVHAILQQVEKLRSQQRAELRNVFKKTLLKLQQLTAAIYKRVKLANKSPLNKQEFKQWRKTWRKQHRKLYKQIRAWRDNHEVQQYYKKIYFACVNLAQELRTFYNIALPGMSGAKDLQTIAPIRAARYRLLIRLRRVKKQVADLPPE